MPLNTIKSATKAAHRRLEDIVIRDIKSIQSPEDYIKFLNNFFCCFHVLEKSIGPLMGDGLLPDYGKRRNSAYLRRDIELLGGTARSYLPVLSVPAITTPLQALGAQYVLEGSVMGGPHIIAMLKKRGIVRGFSFFEGYGTETSSMWGVFMEVIDAHTSSEEARASVIKTAHGTFDFFADVFIRGRQTVS